MLKHINTLQILIAMTKKITLVALLFLGINSLHAQTPTIITNTNTVTNANPTRFVFA